MKRRPRGKPILHCPQCGSTQLVYVGGLILGQVYHCMKCDYVGSFVYETDGPLEPGPDGT